MNRHLERGDRLFALQRYADAAREYLNATLNNEGGSARGYAQAALACFCDGEQAKGRINLAMALGLDPEDPATLLVAAHVATLDGKPDEAREHISKVLRSSPDDPDLLYSASRLEIALGDRNAARTHAKRGLALDPQHEGCLGAIIDAGDLTGPETESYAARLLAVAPLNPDGHLGMSETALDSSRYEQAIAHAREAVRLDPTAYKTLTRLLSAKSHLHPVYRFFAHGELSSLRVPIWLRILGLFVPALAWFVVMLVAVMVAGGESLDETHWMLTVDRMLRPQVLAAIWVIILLSWQDGYTLFHAVFSPGMRPVLKHGLPGLLILNTFTLLSLGALAVHVFGFDWGFYGASLLVLFSKLSIAVLIDRGTLTTSHATCAGLCMAVFAFAIAISGLWWPIFATVVLWTMISAFAALFIFGGSRLSRKPTPPLPTN